MTGNRPREDMPAALLSRVMFWLFTALAFAEAPIASSELFGAAEKRGASLSRAVEPRLQLNSSTDQRPPLAIEEPAQSTQSAHAQDLGEDVSAPWRQTAVLSPPRPGRERIPASQAFPSTQTSLGARAPPSLA